MIFQEDDFVSTKVQKPEAIQRMRKLNISEQVIDTFSSLDIVFCSCRGCLSPLTKSETEMVREYEKETNCLVYHVIHSFANIGETYELLYVSCYVEDWDWENRNIDFGYLLVYSKNISFPLNSESGSIIVKNLNGSLFRIA